MRSISKARSDYSSEDDSIIVSTASTSDSEESDSQDETVKPSQPVLVMKSRSHLLHELPDDLRLWFVCHHVHDAGMTASQMAWRLRAYARINRAHHQEVIDILNRDEFEAVCLASTRYALPVMMKFPEAEKYEAIKFASGVQDLVNTYPHVHADLSVQRDTVGTLNLIHSSAVVPLFNSKLLKSVQIDFSEKSDACFFGDGDRHFPTSNNRVSKRKAELKKASEDGSVVGRLNAELRKLAKNGAGLPVIDLSCKDRLFTTFLFPLGENLARHCIDIKALRSLDLSFNKRMFNVVLEAVETNKAINKKKRNLENYVNHLATFLSGNQSLECLILKRTGFSAMTIAPLAAALEKNKKLRRLDLSCNPIGALIHSSGMQIAGERHSQGAKALTEALKNNQHLTYLNLAYCEFNSHAAHHFVALLKENKTLQQLDLSANPIEPDHPVFADPRVVCSND